MKQLLILIVTLSLVLGACSPSENNTENGSESSSIGLSEAQKLPIQNKILAIGNNVRKIGASCTTGAAVAGLSLFVETIPVFTIIPKAADIEGSGVRVRAISENASTEYFEDRAKAGIIGGGVYSAILDAVGNILNLIKKITMKNYSAPRWDQSWDRLQVAYSGSYATIENMLVGENAVCRDSFRSASNVIKSMFPKKK